MNAKATVFVGLSGGVDSSVAAFRLKQQGYRVVGVFIKVWHPDFMVCNWEQERLDAMRVAAHLDIPFLTCDAEEVYKQEVADYFIAEYQKGRTPNPDVMCNKSVKFGAFLRFAESHGADFIATGHYAQNINGQLHRGIDANKDQSYFLWTLTKEQLAKTLFPVGDTPKEQIRREATAAGIPTATKKDSQGICFLGHIDIPEFISHYTTLTTGNVLNETGAVIGHHQGALVYTLGQRHGFTITTKDTDRSEMYVVAKNIENNTVTVAASKPTITTDEAIQLEDVVLRAAVPNPVSVQFRYRQSPMTACITDLSGTAISLTLEEENEEPASGQSCVLYDGNHCLGGGIIV